MLNNREQEKAKFEKVTKELLKQIKHLQGYHKVITPHNSKGDQSLCICEPRIEEEVIEFKRHNNLITKHGTYTRLSRILGYKDLPELLKTLAVVVSWDKDLLLIIDDSRTGLPPTKVYLEKVVFKLPPIDKGDCVLLVNFDIFSDESSCYLEGNKQSRCHVWKYEGYKSDENLNEEIVEVERLQKWWHDLLYKCQQPDASAYAADARQPCRRCGGGISVRGF
jgi:hypothetical protein